MFDAPLSTILNNGLLGAFVVIMMGVIAWQQRRYERLQEKHEDKSQKMYDQVVIFKDTYHKAMTEQTETNRVMSEKLVSMADSMKTIASSMYRSFMPKGGMPDV